MGEEGLSVHVPAKIQGLLNGLSATPITIGQSKSDVFRFSGPEEKSYYLKVSDTPYVAAEIEQEARVLQWMRAKGLPVPEPVAVERSEGKIYFLLSAVPGQSMADAVAQLGAERCLVLGARFLRRLHSLPIEDCPFQRPLSSTLSLARENLDAGLVDESDFDAENIGTLAEVLYAKLKPRPVEDLVFTHGDYCFPNIITLNGEVSGVVDLGRAGVADRYQDLALFLRSFRLNAGGVNEALFLKEYGLLRGLDPSKLAYFRRLDEFF